MKENNGKSIMKKKTLIINFFAGPGAGKSTMAAGVFYKLKMKGVNCELITEHAKDLTWEKNWTALGNQLLTSATQIYKQERVENQVDIIVTDSPMLLGMFYWSDKNKKKKKYFKNLLYEIFGEKNNLNVYIKRKKKYNPIGRNQTEKEAQEIDKKTIIFLKENNLKFIKVDGTVEGTDKLVEKILKRIKYEI